MIDRIHTVSLNHIILFFLYLQKYKEAVKEFRKENPDFASGYTNDIWWETEQFQKSVRERERKNKEEVQIVKDARQVEIERIATEYAKREFFRVSTSAEGTKLSEEEYIKEIWDRALLEGDIKFRQLNGEANDPEGEIANFAAQQERKQEIMLKKAKQDLRTVLDEENLGGDNIPGLDDEDAPENPDDKKMY